MSTIIVCPLSRLETVFASCGAEDVVTLMRYGKSEVPRLPAKRALRLEFSDIAEARDGYTLPSTTHVEMLLRFGTAWDRARPLLVHCYAGVSRSTAAAFVLACALRSDLDEHEIASHLRARSPTATPNPRIVSLGDAILGRSGRMVSAIEAIGRGIDCFEGVPFSLDLASTAGQIPAYQS